MTTTIRDITSGDTHTVDTRTCCWRRDDLPTQSDAEAGGVDVLAGNGTCTLADCEPGDVVYVESSDASETEPGLVIAWLSEVRS